MQFFENGSSWSSWLRTANLFRREEHTVAVPFNFNVRACANGEVQVAMGEVQMLSDQIWAILFLPVGVFVCL